MSTTPIEPSVTIPDEKMNSVSPKSSKKAGKRITHLIRMAESFITNMKKPGVSRKSRAAMTVTVKLDDIRKFCFKAVAKQTNRSMKKVVKTYTYQRALWKMVEKITVDRLNAFRKRKADKAIAAGKKIRNKFVPIKYKKLDMHGFKGKYVTDPEPKSLVGITYVPEKATEEKIRLALEWHVECANFIKTSSFKSKPNKKGKTKEEKCALVYTYSEHDAKAVVSSVPRKMKVFGNKVGSSVQAPRKMEPSKKKLAVLKKVDEDKKKRVAEMRKKNQERHEANQKRASRRSNSRRHSKFEKTRILRDSKSHHVYAIKRNNAAKAPKDERPPMHGYKKLRSMVRVSRK